MQRPQFPSVPVLLVEDSSPVRSMIRKMLAEVGIETVVEANSAAEAERALQRFSPGLIILDWYLPNGTCEDLLDLVRDPQRSAAPDVPIIVMSARPTVPVVVRAQDMQVRLFLRKPFGPRKLWERICAAIEPVGYIEETSRGPRKRSHERKLAN